MKKVRGELSISISCIRDRWNKFTSESSQLPRINTERFKSAGQEKSTKILISWQELKNQFL